MGQIARCPRPFRSLEVTQVPGPGGQILQDMWLLLARSSWLWSRAGAVERPSGSCHRLKDSFSPCLPHKTHQTPLPTIPDPGHVCLPLRGRKGWGATRPAWLQRKHVWLAPCPGDKDLLGRGEPCSEFVPLGREEEWDWVSLPSFISGEMPCASMRT